MSNVRDDEIEQMSFDVNIIWKDSMSKDSSEIDIMEKYAISSDDEVDDKDLETTTIDEKEGIESLPVLKSVEVKLADQLVTLLKLTLNPIAQDGEMNLDAESNLVMSPKIVEYDELNTESENNLEGKSQEILELNINLECLSHNEPITEKNKSENQTISPIQSNSELEEKATVNKLLLD